MKCKWTFQHTCHIDFDAVLCGAEDDSYILDFRSITRNLRTVLIVLFSFTRGGNHLKIVPSLTMHINTPCQRLKGSSLVLLTK